MTAFNWAVLTACVWGVVPILEKVSLGKVTPYVGLFYRCIGVMLGMILLGAFLVKPQEFKSIDAKSLFFLIAAGFLANFVGQLLFFHGLKSGNISSFVPIAGSFPMVSFILGVVLLGEAVTPIKVGGVVMIIIGIWALKTG
jgi:transporter family protein